ncbi:MAG: hypothetical protein RSF40_00635 [Oscillospiraceae bacterium]
MKFHFSLKDKEVSLDADIEKLIEKNLDIKSKKPEKTHTIKSSKRKSGKTWSLNIGIN